MRPSNWQSAELVNFLWQLTPDIACSYLGLLPRFALAGGGLDDLAGPF